MFHTDRFLKYSFSGVGSRNAFTIPGCIPHPNIISDLSFFNWFSYALHKMGSYAGLTPDLRDVGHAPGAVIKYAKDRIVDVHAAPSERLQSKFYFAKQRMRVKGWKVLHVFSGITGRKSKTSGNVVNDLEVGFALTRDCDALYSTKVVVIVFRGSSKGAHSLGPDWSTNFNHDNECISKIFPEYSQPENTLHRGVAERFLSIQSQLELLVMSCLHKDPNVKFVVTGHSLGGAMAQLAAWNISRLINLYTTKQFKRSFDNILENKIWAFLISSPKVLNQSTASIYDRNIGIYNTIWLQGKNDIVPGLSNLIAGTLKCTSRRKTVGLVCEDKLSDIISRARDYEHRTDPFSLSHYVLKTSEKSDPGFFPEIVPTDLTHLLSKVHHPRGYGGSKFLAHKFL